MKTVVDLTTAIKNFILGKNAAVLENIAPVEESPSTAAYAIGDKLVYNDVLYDVTAAIAIGDDLEVGTNIAASDNVTTQIAGRATNAAIANEAVTRGAMGAKNLIPYPYYNGASWEANGITFIANADGSVTISGEATDDAYFRFTYYTGSKHLALKSGKSYIISATGHADIAVQLRDDTNTRVESARATDATYACLTDGNYDAIISVDNGANYSTAVTIHPMIRLATDADSTYQPYAKTNKELTDEVGTLSTGKAGTDQLYNRNLIDNPFFTVNQRGFTSLSGTGFTVDRWKNWTAAGTVSVSNNVITISPTVSGTTFLWGQTVKNINAMLAGKKATLSIMLSDGTIVSKTFTYPTTISANSQVVQIPLGSTHFFEIYAYTQGYARVGYYNQSGILPSAALSIKAVKLEVGEVSTLGLDVAPNYAEELAKCKSSDAASDDTYANQGDIVVEKELSLTQTVSTSADTTYTFSDIAIRSDSDVVVLADTWGIVPSNVVTTAGQCVVTIPKQASAISLGIKIRIRG